MNLKKVLICEDDVAIQELIDLYLDSDYYQTIFANDGEEALQKFHNEQPDIILLDINIPIKNGIEVCEEIRKSSLIPIIFVTSLDDSQDVVKGLMAGADDYVTKPFEMNVLLARILANTRYKKQHTEGYISLNDLEIDFEKNQVKKCGHEIFLHPKELNLLFSLVLHKYCHNFQFNYSFCLEQKK